MGVSLLGYVWGETVAIRPILAASETRLLFVELCVGVAFTKHIRAETPSHAVVSKSPPPPQTGMAGAGPRVVDSRQIRSSVSLLRAQYTFVDIWSVGVSIQRNSNKFSASKKRSKTVNICKDC